MMRRYVTLFAMAVLLVPVAVSANPEKTFTLPGGATIEMVWIEPGGFLMGSPEDEPGRDEDEGPQFWVEISQGFWLGKFELTVEQWHSVMGGTPDNGPNYPKEWISWNNVQTFIGILNDAEGAEVYRLPREAEWEYACRAGTTARWSFGDDEGELGRYAWYRGNSGMVVHEVGTRDPNGWGLGS